MGVSKVTPPTCRKICAGKKKNIMYEQCRDEEGKVVSMRRIGVCSGGGVVENTDVRIIEQEIKTEVE